MKTSAAFEESELDIIPGFQANNDLKTITQRNQISTIASKQQRDLVRAINRNHINTESDAWRERVDPVTGLPVFAAGDDDESGPNFIPLPNDTDAVSYTLPQVRGDLTAISTQVMHTICSVFGVPPHSLEGARTTAKQIETGDDLLANTIAALETRAKKVMLDICYLLFQKDDEVEAGDVTVVFPGLRRSNCIEHLWRKRLLKPEAYHRHLLDFYGIQGRDLIDGFGEIDPLEQRQSKRTKIEEPFL